MIAASTASLVIRLVVSLGIVVALMLLATKVVRKRGYGGSVAAPARGAPSTSVEVLARRGLSRNSSVVVVRAGGRNLVLGVSDNNVTLLSEADEAAVEQELAEVMPAPRTGPARGAQGAGSAWKVLLDQMRERTVRRVT
jgi:flagellar biogenesis protein FliO